MLGIQRHITEIKTTVHLNSGLNYANNSMHPREEGALSRFRSFKSGARGTFALDNAAATKLSVKDGAL